METDAAAAALARALPAICFRSTNEEYECNDRAIGVEAVVHGFTLRASESFRSMAREQLNDCLQDDGKTRRPLIVQIHEALTAYRRDPAERARMAFRAAEQGQERDVEAVERFLATLKTTHAGRCGWWAEDGRKATQDIPAAIRAARRHCRGRPQSRLRRPLTAHAGASLNDEQDKLSVAAPFPSSLNDSVLRYG